MRDDVHILYLLAIIGFSDQYLSSKSFSPKNITVSDKNLNSDRFNRQNNSTHPTKKRCARK